MKHDFLCPKCQGYLNVGERVIFTIKKKDWPGGILLLSPKLGEYIYEKHPSHSIEPGEKLEFHCPICQYDLTVDGADNFAKVLMKEGDNDMFYVVFSKKEGEKCTYKISESKIEETYGEDAGRNIDMLSASFFR
ncbi:MAG: hypothetical protein ACLFNU_06885 [Bacteroidales bacterium]